MSSDKERLQIAQWVLERNLAWIAAAEVKVGFIVAIDTAMLAGLGATFSSVDEIGRTVCAWLFATLAAGGLGGALFCTAMAVLPRVNGPEKSLVFFGRVCTCAEGDYVESFKKATDSELLEDWSAQIHRNAQIANVKFAWVRRSMWCSFLSLIPWIAAIIALLYIK